MISGCIDGLVQDSDNSSVLAVELPQSCSKPCYEVSMEDVMMSQWFRVGSSL